ncbi:protein inturned [Drosophila guanche]|uniref:Blast:Protein inturned n=1 Tax=Drosophila guanche TaxID=7266 RepID=A0A3B0JRI8_DROGU|nr:protein inturned [Drosophila guanche]SPP84744.1 blast:Protein inturned [Drosophila guanche]
MRKSPGSLAGIDANSEAFSSSSSSISNSYSDGSDSASWEEYVATDGSLFYVEYMPQNVKSSIASSAERRVEFMRRSLRLGKKPMRRQHNASRPSHSQTQTQAQMQSQSHSRNQLSEPEPEPDEFRFSHFKTSHGDASSSNKKLQLVITAADRFRFGRRSTAVESILGFRVLPFPDQPECLMVEGFVHDISAMQHDIKRGDWFKSLNGIELYASNVDELLQQFVEPTQVCLCFQASSSSTDAAAAAAAAAAADPSYGPGQQEEQVRKVENFAMFADKFEELLLPEPDPLKTADPMPFGMLLLPPECYQHDQHQDSLYYYPEGATTNFLYKARGSFLTLHAVLSELHTQPITSRLLVDQVPYHVNYRRLNGFLVLFAYANSLYSAAECNMRSDELIGYIRFSMPGLVLENFAGAETEGRSGDLRSFLRHFCGIQRTRLLLNCRGATQFEELLGQSRNLPLPKEAQLRVFDALSEMEAMDYRNWNDEPLTTHREFFIYGSALYYNQFLVASLLPAEVRANVEGFLRCRGIFDLIGAPSVRVRELYVWEEIVLPNATGRYFLTICTRNHLSLAVILKIFDAPDMAPDTVVGPSLFYIEEIQETLDHLIQCGIESLAMFWSISNKRPQVLEQIGAEAKDEKEANGKLESFLKQKLTVLSTAVSVDEEAQLCSSLGGSSIHSLTPSEDDSSRKRLTPIHGGAEDSDSESDWENFAVQHPLHYGLNLRSETHNQSQMTESMWKEISNVVPVKISAGWKNCVLYYVYIDIANGSLFAPFNDCAESATFLSEIRQACHIIHSVLERSKHYRRQLTESIRGPVNANGHSSSNAISLVREHGMTLEAFPPSRTENQACSTKSFRFVVVGRLFQSPAKEVYICHRSDVPQNIVEMAFRLSFFSMG